MKDRDNKEEELLQLAKREELLLKWTKKEEEPLGRALGEDDGEA